MAVLNICLFLLISVKLLLVVLTYDIYFFYHFVQLIFFIAITYGFNYCNSNTLNIVLKDEHLRVLLYLFLCMGILINSLDFFCVVLYGADAVNHTILSTSSCMKSRFYNLCAPMVNQHWGKFNFPRDEVGLVVDVGSKAFFASFIGVSAGCGSVLVPYQYAKMNGWKGVTTAILNAKKTQYAIVGYTSVVSTMNVYSSLGPNHYMVLDAGIAIGLL